MATVRHCRVTLGPRLTSTLWCIQPCLSLTVYRTHEDTCHARKHMRALGFVLRSVLRNTETRSVRSRVATQRLLHLLCQCKTLGSFQYRSNPRDELRMAELPVKHASLICGSAWFCALVNFARGENQRGFSGRFLATSVPETIAGPVVVDAM